MGKTKTKTKTSPEAITASALEDLKAQIEEQKAAMEAQAQEINQLKKEKAAISKATRKGVSDLKKNYPSAGFHSTLSRTIIGSGEQMWNEGEALAFVLHEHEVREGDFYRDFARQFGSPEFVGKGGDKKRAAVIDAHANDLVSRLAETRSAYLDTICEFLGNSNIPLGKTMGSTIASEILPTKGSVDDSTETANESEIVDGRKRK